MTAPQLHQILAQERNAELDRSAQRARVAIEASTERRNSRDGNPIAHLGARLARLTARRAPSCP